MQKISKIKIAKKEKQGLEGLKTKFKRNMQYLKGNHKNQKWKIMKQKKEKLAMINNI